MESAQEIARPVVGHNEQATPLGNSLGLRNLRRSSLLGLGFTRESELGPLFFFLRRTPIRKSAGPWGSVRASRQRDRCSPHTSLGSPARLERVMLSVEQRQWRANLRAELALNGEGEGYDHN